MATRPEIKVKKSEPEEAQAPPSQTAKKEAGNYRLQVDRQTKAFYMTEEQAEAAGLVSRRAIRWCRCRSTIPPKASTRSSSCRRSSRGAPGGASRRRFFSQRPLVIAGLGHP